VGLKTVQSQTEERCWFSS